MTPASPVSSLPRQSQRAFTLLELLVSMALLAFLLVVLMSIVDGSTKLWRQSENRVDSYREARGAINTISADLASILPSINPKLFQWNTLPDLPASIEKPPDYSHLFFLTSQPSDAQDPDEKKSDLCIVGYYLAYAKASINSDRSTLNLYRYFQSSDTTFDKTIKNLQTGGLIPASLAPSPQPSIGDEMLARNVTGFVVRAYTVTSDETLPDGSIKKGELIVFKQAAETPMPNIIEVELTVVNNETAKRLNNIGAWKNKTSVDYKQNQRTFATRVRLPTDTAISTPTPTPTPEPSPTPST